ncbi:molybdopterin dinucleotide binding domain protein [Acinetobacter sp. 263903-1]|jgi:assimilatory nitrate reductase catalytic subunit|uniref:nitrate reductase n=1 Tax=Acinetobacter TaxID=469 RepID=UPI000450624D|nr:MULTISPECIES: nitrate reductase [Acinetobacter]EXB31895.1 molybdopterin dinucleotide binding domain protein [Acinetobacter sp. 1461402]EXB72791.1 molybdopterin dinucleotide binding domain protein [Acinetobacter sp. 230853]KCX37448.1 molybdopterin dinucleotide binding domain protein [Acinetobacter sp. 263903-1]WGX73906.1 molybdopterin-dependent oxidoreductase [Acinetobacter radioresistens]
MNSIPIVELESSTDLKTITTQTTCPYCGVGCGVTAHVTPTPSGLKVAIEGDVNHPTNYGKLCIKGSNLADTLGLETRVLEPIIGRKDQQEITSWDTATSIIAKKFQQCIDQYGRDSIAFYVSGQLLTEDYYVVNKFVKGYFGTANIDTNSRLCMSSAVAAHKRVFGEDIVPASYEDFEHTDMVVLVGSNTAWCHPVLYQRIMKAKEQRNLFVVVVDPRFTSTCEAADLHLPILPGQDVALFNGLLQYLWKNGHTDQKFIAQYTQGLEQTLVQSETESSIEAVAQRTGITADKLRNFYEKFAQTEKVMTLFSMGVNQSSQGVNKANSISNCHLLTGKIGKLGAAPFSMTGQPNAMGGREVGGLANMLAAHLELENESHQQLVQNFWQSPYIAKQAGLKAVDLFQAVESGKIKAIWIMATNPVVSMPDADQVKRALEKCDFVVVSDICQNTDTSQYADVLLPALGWGEKDGTVTNSERRISRQRAFLDIPGQAKADWWAISQVAQKMGFSGFDFNNSHDIFLEHARLSAEQNSHLSQRSETPYFRYFNLKGLTDLSLAEYNELKPVQWPVWSKDQADHLVTRLYSQGQFSHADGKAKFIAVSAVDPFYPICSEFPLILNTGRIRDQWHTMSRTGLSANLSTHRAEPYCEIHPHDALKYGIKDDELVEVKSRWGNCVLRAMVSDNIRRGQVFAPIHWNDQVASDARIGKIVNPVVDAISGEPEFKHTPVLIQPFHIQWQGVFYVRQGFEKTVQSSIENMVWWVKITTTKALRYELADRQKFAHTTEHLKELFPFQDESFEWLNLEDQTAHISHTVVLKEGHLIASLYIAPKALLPDRDWIANLFKRERLSAMHRKALLAGQPMSMVNNEGPLVCSCFKVGKNRIIETIKTKNITDEKQITACLKAGGNCGSCLPEIRGLIKACQMEAVE